jgi:hypothetical protein
MMRALLLTALAAAIILPGFPAAALTIVVDAAGSGDYLTIQEGLSASSTGDIVRVEPGTYAGSGNRALDFGGRGVVLWAPAGPESTVIDCGSAARGIFFHSGEDTTSVVRGFTVTRGYASQGGAINCTGTSPLIEDCWFVSNSATSGAGAFFASSSAKLRNCVFRGNTALYGSGASFLSSAVSVRNCTFCRNGGGGGAQGTLYCFNAPAPSLRRCVIAFSTAGPAMTCAGGSAPLTNHSIVFGNAGGDALCGTATSNLSVDPLFCGMDTQDLTLCGNSPCLVGNNAWGEAVGALGVGCGSCTSPVQPVTWGRLKSLYR